MQVGHLREKRLVPYFISYALPVSMPVDLVLWVREGLQRPQKPSHSGSYWPCQKLGEGQREFLLRVWPPPEPAPWEVQMGPNHLHIKCMKEESSEHWWSCPLWSQEQCPSQFFFVSVWWVFYVEFEGLTSLTYSGYLVDPKVPPTDTDFSLFQSVNSEKKVQFLSLKELFMYNKNERHHYLKEEKIVIHR